MEIQIKKRDFIDELEFLDAISTPQIKGTYNELAKKFAKSIEEQLAIASKALNLSTEKISVDNFIELINGLYDITLTEKDYYDVFSLAYNRKFIPYKVDLIRTYMVRNALKFNGYNLTSNEDVETEFKIVYSEDFRHNKDNRYTIKELKQLIKDRKIIILDEFDIEVTTPERLQEPYEKFPVHKNYKSMKEDNPFYLHIITYIRQTITNEKIKKDIYEYLVNLKSRINEVLANVNSHTFLTNLAKECQKELDKSNILSRLESLINDSLKVSITEEERRRQILESEYEYPPLHVTQETIDNIKAHPELHTECPVRVQMGKIYTNEEYEERTKEVLSRPLPGDEKKGRLTRKRSRRKKRQKNNN